MGCAASVSVAPHPGVLALAKDIGRVKSEAQFQVLLGLYRNIIPSDGESSGKEHGKLSGTWVYIGANSSGRLSPRHRP